MITRTRTSLLVGLRDRDNQRAWSGFCGRFGPLVEGLARQMGVGDPDAQDVAQETMLAFAEAYRRGEYDRDKGRLRTWLLGIARNKVCDFRRRKAREAARGMGAGHVGIEKIADDETLSKLWDAQWTRHVVKSCLAKVERQVQSETMRAFQLVALEGWPAQKVADQLGMTVNAVYLAKHRVLSRLRESEQEFEELLD